MYVCEKEKKKAERKKNAEGSGRRQKEIMMIEKVPVTLSQYESSLILWSQNHGKLSNLIIWKFILQMDF